MDNPVLLNLGCGNKHLPSPWINVDAYEEYNTPNFLRADILNLKEFFKPNSVDHILASHVVEHIDTSKVTECITNWLNLLKPGGSLAIELPDLIKCCQNVVRGYIENNVGLHLHSGLLGLFGDQKASIDNPLMIHRWCYSDQSLAHLARRAGFHSMVKEKPTQKPWVADIRDLRMVFFKEGERLEYARYYTRAE